MIDRALEIKPLLAHLVSNLTSLSNNWPNEEEWNILTILADLLAPFASVTRVISAFSYPTIGEVKLLFEAPNQTPQPVLNELELYFTSNSPGDEIVPLEW
ncbi:uncharacterized protein OCT59_019520 [Rhizophagus irregularis]|uniref:uncharacterized protein n=1 Tax=Rhizophagus irregularis TaxID=588596 RepID=UPI00332B4BBD|nr:hypothetical protein OCT59_019520 [Rhizophagus irregularis]